MIKILVSILIVLLFVAVNSNPFDKEQRKHKSMMFPGGGPPGIAVLKYDHLVGKIGRDAVNTIRTEHPELSVEEVPKVNGSIVFCCYFEKYCCILFIYLLSHTVNIILSIDGF